MAFFERFISPNSIVISEENEALRRLGFIIKDFNTCSHKRDYSHSNKGLNDGGSLFITFA